MEPVNNSQQVSPPPVAPVINPTPPPPSPQKKKGKLGLLISLLIIFFLLCVSGAAGYTIYKNLSANGIGETACTLEAMICPDGSSVGRTGPNCEFTPCPTATPTPDNNAGLQILEGLIDYEIPDGWNKEILTNSFGTRIRINSKDYKPEITDIILYSGARITISKIFYDNPRTMAELINSYNETAGTQMVAVKKIGGKDAVYVLSNYEGFYESYDIPYGNEWLNIAFQYPGQTYEEAMESRNVYLPDIDTFLKSLKFNF